MKRISVFSFILLVAVMLSSCVGDLIKSPFAEESKLVNFEAESSDISEKEESSSVVSETESNVTESSVEADESDEGLTIPDPVPPEDFDKIEVPSAGIGTLPSTPCRQFATDAKGVRIAFTKESALAATECITNCTVGITAVYDGRVTRFFDSSTGAYYHAVSGKYLFACHDGYFLSGDSVYFDSRYAIQFKRSSADSSIVTYTNDAHPPHGLESFNYIFSVADDRVFAYDYELYNVVGGGVSVCRYYSSDVSIYESFRANWIVNLDENCLGKYGMFKNGTLVAPFEYDELVTGQNSSGLGVYLAVKDGRYYYISTSGYNLTPDGFDCGTQPYDNRAWVFNGDQGYILEFN